MLHFTNFLCKIIYISKLTINYTIASNMGGGGQGGDNLSLPVPRSPASLYLFVPLSPDSGPV